MVAQRAVRTHTLTVGLYADITRSITHLVRLISLQTDAHAHSRMIHLVGSVQICAHRAGTQAQMVVIGRYKTQEHGCAYVRVSGVELHVRRKRV